MVGLRAAADIVDDKSKDRPSFECLNYLKTYYRGAYHA